MVKPIKTYYGPRRVPPQLVSGNGWAEQATLGSLFKVHDNAGASIRKLVDTPMEDPGEVVFSTCDGTKKFLTNRLNNVIITHVR